MATQTVMDSGEAGDLLDELLNTTMAAEGVARTIAEASDHGSGPQQAAIAISMLLERVMEIGRKVYPRAEGGAWPRVQGAEGGRHD